MILLPENRHRPWTAGSSLRGYSHDFLRTKTVGQIFGFRKNRKNRSKNIACLLSNIEQNKDKKKGDKRLREVKNIFRGTLSDHSFPAFSQMISLSPSPFQTDGGADHRIKLNFLDVGY